MTTFNFRDKDMIVRQLRDLADRIDDERMEVIDHEWEMEQNLVDISSRGSPRQTIPGARSWRLELNLAPGRRR